MTHASPWWGARLLYPDGAVQHGGVLMGMGGLCNHADRFLPPGVPGYHHRAVLPQEMSAVTAACMLVRRSRYAAIGGLNEDYPSAFNDVDFCLRLREAGDGVVYDGSTALTHFEGTTYGDSHYPEERVAFQLIEAERMRRRWASDLRR